MNNPFTVKEENNFSSNNILNNPFENMEENNRLNNPFSNIEENNMLNNPFANELNEVLPDALTHNLLIEIWVEECGRKKNTYISGWLDENIKEHIKYIKKNYGCNGTLKDTEDNKKLVMFQGNQVKYVIEYLKKQGINSNNIYIKG